MYHNIEVDWKSFEYIFSGHTQHAFEQLAYILFCYEFKQDIGVFKYFNQTGIETNPVDFENEVIGFQAKYYDASTKIGEKVADFYNTVNKAKRKNPTLTKIYVYVNKEMSESTSKEKQVPKYQEDIENYAIEQGIIIEWRVPSNIERLLFSEDIPHFVRDFFFNSQPGIRKFIEQSKLHTETLIDTIDNSITYNEHKLVVDHSLDSVNDFIFSDNKHLIIHGHSGTGKSGMVKSFYQSSRTDIPIFLFRATDFGFNSLSEFSKQFGDCNINDFLTAFSNSKYKIIIIDSAEKRFSMVPTVLDDFLQKALKNNWKIVHTIRSSHKDSYINYVLKTTEYIDCQLQSISFQAVQNFLIKCDIPYPTIKTMQDLISNLFYLNLYVSSFSKNSDYFQTRNLFLTHIWNTRIKGIPHDTEANGFAREQLVLNMFKDILRNNSYYYLNESAQDQLLLNHLREDGIIDCDDVYKGFYFTHDIYEELVARHLITIAYQSARDELEFHNLLDINMSMRKYYRLWLHDRIYEDETFAVNKFIVKSVTNELINKIWKDEILIALMESDLHSKVLELMDDLFNDDRELLIRSIFLLNTACKKVDYDAASSILTKEEQDSKINLLYRFTKPSGAGWEYLIEYMYTHMLDIEWNVGFIKLVYEMISSWIKDVKQGVATKRAGLLALYLYDLLEDSELKYKADKDIRRRLCITILESSFEIEGTLLEIFNQILEEGVSKYRYKYSDLVQVLLGDASNSFIPCQTMPKTVMNLCEKTWNKKTESNCDPYFIPFNDSLGVEAAFGLEHSTHHDYFPTSALRTPVFMLLQHSPDDGLDFILNFINKAVETYEKSLKNQRHIGIYSINITFPSGEQVSQLCNGQLWKLHRGMSGGPNLLECILMALEKWLLNSIPYMNKEQANKLCEYLLYKSKSVAITSVINTLVLAYPEKLFNIACCLITIGEDVFTLDNQRLIHERSSSWFRNVIPNNQLYDKERITSNNLSFRSKCLEEIIINYQLASEETKFEEFTKNREKLYKCMDDLTSTVTPENTNLRYILNRIDLRRMKPDIESEIIKDGRKYIILKADEEEDLAALREERRRQTDSFYVFLNVSQWARSKYEEQKEDMNGYNHYEQNPIKAFDEMVLLCENMEKGIKYDQLTMTSPIYISAVLLRNYENILSFEQKEYCKQSLVKNLNLITISDQNSYLIDNGQPIIDSISYIIKDTNNPEDHFKLDVDLLIVLFLDSSQGRSSHLAFAKWMWRDCPKDAEVVFKMYVLLKKEFINWNRSKKGKTLEEFIKKQNRILRQVFNGFRKMEDLDYSLLDNDSILSAMMLLDVCNKHHWKIVNKIAPPIWKELFQENYRRSGERKIDYELEVAYVQWLSKYVYSTTDNIRNELLNALEPCLAISRYMENFITNILFEHDAKGNNSVLWQIWGKMYNPITELSNTYKEKVVSGRDCYDLDGVISTYCFAWPYWGANQKEWIGIKEQYLSFFDKAVRDLGFLPITLYSISRLINSVGYSYIKEGIRWISRIISNNDHLVHSKLQINTIYYLEEIVLRFSKEHGDSVKKIPSFRDDLLCILNFLVSQGSTVGFFIREEFY